MLQDEFLLMLSSADMCPNTFEPCFMLHVKSKIRYLEDVCKNFHRLWQLNTTCVMVTVVIKLHRQYSPYRITPTYLCHSKHTYNIYTWNVPVIVNRP